MMSEHEVELQELAWYPRKKIEIVKYKLNGRNPVKIIQSELKDSRHERKQYLKVLLEAVEGPEESMRKNFTRVSKKRYLEVDEQIDCLIEQARDPNILGRTWVGWSPYV
jgi:DNA-dependent protein kinase catalytic subunit